MKAAFYIGGLALFLSAQAMAAYEPTHRLWSEVLKNYQAPDGRMQYKRLKSDTVPKPDHPFSTYIRDILSVKNSVYESWKREEKMAYLINAYNALTVNLILDNYPTTGIKKIGNILKSPWKIEFFSLLDNTIKDLDTIEHKILRPQFRDPRVHAAVNCASISCPRLQPVAFQRDGLEGQLELAFREFLADPTRNRFEPESKTLYLSKIFEWFEDDFKEKGGVLKAVEKWGPPIALETLKGAEAKIKYLPYKWGLNEATNDLAVK